MYPFGKLGVMQRAAVLLCVALLGVLGAACGNGNRGFPRDPGQYSIQPNTLSYDGKDYRLAWTDSNNQIHWAEGPEVRMQQDDRTFLEAGSAGPVVHLKEDEGVTVRGRDRDGEFSSLWFPFFLGTALGGVGRPTINVPYPGDPPSRGPSYQYPPTDTFGRGDQMNGSIERPKPQAPDYSKVQPAPYAVSGQAGGTGAGTAATSKASPALSGQAGGTGSGTAATNKGTFSKGGSGINAGSGWFSGPGSDSKSKSGIGSTPSRPSNPLPSRPSAPIRRR